MAAEGAMQRPGGAEDRVALGHVPIMKRGDLKGSEI
jgi:hypothetical protein